HLPGPAVGLLRPEPLLAQGRAGLRAAAGRGRLSGRRGRPLGGQGVGMRRGGQGRAPPLPPWRGPLEWRKRISGMTIDGTSDAGQRPIVPDLETDLAPPRVAGLVSSWGSGPS